MIAVWVGAAGALGAVARFVLEQWVTASRRARFPLGTFVVNVTGSFLLGAVTGLATAHGLPADARTIAGAGFLGGYTTFSTFAYEVVRRAEAHEPAVAAGYLVASALAGTVAATLGLALTGGL
ncbi:MAG: CrcB family protein [Acidimicrobiia bacterium]